MQESINQYIKYHKQTHQIQQSQTQNNYKSNRSQNSNESKGFQLDSNYMKEMDDIDFDISNSKLGKEEVEKSPANNNENIIIREKNALKAKENQNHHQMINEDKIELEQGEQSLLQMLVRNKKSQPNHQAEENLIVQEYHEVSKRINDVQSIETIFPDYLRSGFSNLFSIKSQQNEIKNIDQFMKNIDEVQQFEFKASLDKNILIQHIEPKLSKISSTSKGENIQSKNQAKQEYLNFIAMRSQASSSQSFSDERNKQERNQSTIKKTYEKNEPICEESNENQQLDDDNSQCIQQFKDQQYQICGNLSYGQQSEVFKKYILNMRKTLRREYEKCRLRQQQLSERNQINSDKPFAYLLQQWTDQPSEIKEINQKEFLIYYKRQQQTKAMLSKQKQKLEDLLRETNEKRQNELMVQMKEIEQEYQFTGRKSEAIKNQSPLMIQSQVQKNQKLENQGQQELFQKVKFSRIKENAYNSAKFRSYLRVIMLQMSNYIDMTDKVELVFRMDYRKLMAYYIDIVGPNQMIRYETFEDSQNQEDSPEPEKVTQAQERKLQQKNQEYRELDAQQHIQQNVSQYLRGNNEQIIQSNAQLISAVENLDQKQNHQGSSLNWTQQDGQMIINVPEQINDSIKLSNLLIGKPETMATQQNKQNQEFIQTKGSKNVQCISPDKNIHTTKAHNNQGNHQAGGNRGIEIQQQVRQSKIYSSQSHNQINQMQTCTFVENRQRDEIIHQIITEPSSPKTPKFDTQTASNQLTAEIEMLIQIQNNLPGNNNKDDNRIDLDNDNDNDNEFTPQFSQMPHNFDINFENFESPVQQQDAFAINPDRQLNYTFQMNNQGGSNENNDKDKVVKQPNIVINIIEDDEEELVIPKKIVQSPKNNEKTSNIIKQVQIASENNQNNDVIENQVSKQMENNKNEQIMNINIVDTVNLTETNNVPQISEPHLVNGMFSASQIRQLLLQSYPFFADNISNATDGEIITLYYELTSGNDEYEQSNKISNEEPKQTGQINVESNKSKEIVEKNPNETISASVNENSNADQIEKMRKKSINQSKQINLIDLEDSENQDKNHLTPLIIGSNQILKQNNLEKQKQNIIKESFNILNPEKSNQIIQSVIQQSHQTETNEFVDSSALSNIQFREDITQEQIDLIIQTLMEASPQIQVQIKSLTKQQILDLYKQSIKEKFQIQTEEDKPQDKNCNTINNQNVFEKKKKQKTQEVINLLEDDSFTNDHQQNQSEEQNILKSLHNTNQNNSLNQPQSEIPKEPENIHNQIEQQEIHVSKFSYLKLFEEKKMLDQDKILKLKKFWKGPNKPLDKPYVKIEIEKLCEFIQSHDYENKLKDTLLKNTKSRYEKAKDIAMLYVRQLKKNNIKYAGFEYYNGLKMNKNNKNIILPWNKQFTVIKSAQINDLVSKEKKVLIQIPKITEERKARILQLRKKKYSSIAQITNSQQENKSNLSNQFNNIPSQPQHFSIGEHRINSPVSQINSEHRISSPVSQMNRIVPMNETSKIPILNKYCIMFYEKQEELEERDLARLEEQISYNKTRKRVKKSYQVQTDSNKIMEMLKEIIQIGVIGSEQNNNKRIQLQE